MKILRSVLLQAFIAACLFGLCWNLFPERVPAPEFTAGDFVEVTTPGSSAVLVVESVLLQKNVKGDWEVWYRAGQMVKNKPVFTTYEAQTFHDLGYRLPEDREAAARRYFAQ